MHKDVDIMGWFDTVGVLKIYLLEHMRILIQRKSREKGTGNRGVTPKYGTNE